MPFTELHNISKHAVYLQEAVASQMLLVDEILTRIERNMGQPYGQQERNSVRESLEYRKTLFHSTQLRLNSLQRRIDNVISLAFNLVTQQDSMIMIKDSKILLQDSNTMRAIAVITMLFLPGTAVASVMSNTLFDGGEVTPLFRVMWHIVVPLTVTTFVVVYLWMRWMESKLSLGPSKNSKTDGGDMA